MRSGLKRFVVALPLWACLPVDVAAKTAALSEPTEFALDRDETIELATPLVAGEYLLTVDTRRADGQLGNLIGKVSLLDGDGAVIHDSTIAFNEIDYAYRGVSAFELKRKTTLHVRVVNAHDKAEYMSVLQPLPAGFLSRRRRLDAPVESVDQADFPFTPAKAGLMPFPFFGTVAPRLVALGEEQAGELEGGESAYYCAMAPKSDYKVVFGLEQARRQKSNLIGYAALLDSAGGSQQKIAEINAIDVSFKQAGGFSLKRGSLVVLRVSNRHQNKVKYTLLLREADGD